MTPSTSRAHATARFSTTPSTSCAPSTSMTPPPTPHASEMTPPTPRAAAKPSSSSTTSTSRTSDIKCHRCHRVGHFQHDCPSKKSYIATDDGGYVSASDVKDDFVLQTNNAGDLDDDDPEVIGSEHTVQHQNLCGAAGFKCSSGHFREASMPQLIPDFLRHQGLSCTHHH
jgi:hypothetical protein